jgi:hypothetical protein
MDIKGKINMDKQDRQDKSFKNSLNAFCGI